MRVTACGSLPGRDFRHATKKMLTTFPDLTPWPELPARGPGSAMIGRAAALLADLPVELGAHGWQLSAHRDKESRHAIAQWRQDLDDMEELAQGFNGTLKIGICGPLTLAACLGRPKAEIALADFGARKDIAAALAEGISTLLAELKRRLPMVRTQLQLDEPLLPAILEGQVASSSGYQRLAKVEFAEASEILNLVNHQGILHCCSPGDWLKLVSAANFNGIYLDCSGDINAVHEQLSGFMTSGIQLVAGIIDTSILNQEVQISQVVTKVLQLLAQLDLGSEILDKQLFLGPACGLGQWEPANADSMLRSIVTSAALATNALDQAIK